MTRIEDARRQVLEKADELNRTVRGERPAPYASVLALYTEDDVGELYYIAEACRAMSLYDLYPQEHVDAMAAFIDKRFPDGRVLEVCAGDGRLTRFLRQAGIDMLQATDLKDNGRSRCDFNEERYGEDVKEQEAVAAVKEAQPDLVVLAWPPYTYDITEQILDAGFPVLYIGEKEGGCCGTPELWDYPHEHIGCSRWQLCRMDMVWMRAPMNAKSRTVLFKPSVSRA